MMSHPAATWRPELSVRKRSWLECSAHGDPRRRIMMWLACGSHARDAFLMQASETLEASHGHI